MRPTKRAPWMEANDILESSDGLCWKRERRPVRLVSLFQRAGRYALPLFDKAGAPLVEDSYGNALDEPRPRLRGCRCAVPCLAFTCVSSHHRGARATPWCRGGDDELPPREPGDDRDVGRCDECDLKWQKNQRAAKRRDEQRGKTTTTTTTTMTMTMAKKLIGTGIFGWCSSERHSQRYGSVHLADAPYEGAARAEVYYDEATLARWQGERVRLTARVTESRPSAHAGDLALNIAPRQPAAGGEIDLGVGRLQVKTGYDGMPDIVLAPGDSREHFWIDPRQLYRLHDQTVEIYAELTTDDFSPAPEFQPAGKKRAFDNGDGSLQVTGISLEEALGGSSVRILPRVERVGESLCALDFSPPGAGRELDVE